MIIAIVAILCSVVFCYPLISLYEGKNYSINLEIKKNDNFFRALSFVGIKRNFPVRLYMKVSRNNGRHMKPGCYTIDGKYSVVDIIKMLTNGNPANNKITIPEGAYLEQVIDRICLNDDNLKKAYFEALKEIKFPYPTPDNNFEGYFYPSTYFIPKNYTPKETVEVFLDEFLRRFPPEKYPDKEDFYRKLILASIVEREAKLSKEKPLIASVFYNRINNNKRLGSDPTISYLHKYSKNRLFYSDLRISSPYNTYINEGLPPSPISNPCEETINAVYNPEKSDYLFFVSKQDGTGEHFFSKTYEDHLEFIINKRMLNKKINQ